MSFDITFMNCTDPHNKISKSPATVFTLTGTLKQGCDITDPVILVEHEKPLNVNYAYIQEFSRYYYIKKIESYRSEQRGNTRTGLWEVSMHCDVLKSFADAILSSECIASKSSTRYNLYINDDDYKCQQNDIIQTKLFSQGFNLANSSFVLMMTCSTGVPSS